MRTVAIHLLLAAGVTGAAHAQLLPPPKPGDEQPRADVTRQARPVMLGPAAAAAQGQLLPPPKPGDEQPRADITRGAQGALIPGATRGRQSDWCEEDCRKAPGTGAGPTVPGGVRASGPGTQTEDDEYVGRKPKSLNTTPSARLLTPQGPIVAPTVAPPMTRPALPVAAPGSTAPKPRLGNKTRATGDEDEMEDLDIQRRKAQGLPDNKPSTFTPKTQPGTESPRGSERR